ncbi:MAG: DoxX family protein [Vicinamibacteria bacterium]
MKFTTHPELLRGMAHLGLPESLAKPLGLLELLCVVVYLIPGTSVLGALLFHRLCWRCHPHASANWRTRFCPDRVRHFDLAGPLFA